jgi:hypothetical protein
MKIESKLFKKPLPLKAISKHPTKSYLSSIKSVYVTERLNEIFGYDGWEITEVQPISQGENGMVVLSVTMKFHFENRTITKICIAGNDNGGSKSKNFDLGDAYKGAITDAITKIASWMDIGFDVFAGKAGKPGYTVPQEKIKANKEQFKQSINYVTEGGDLSKLLSKYTFTKVQLEELKAI